MYKRKIEKRSAEIHNAMAKNGLDKWFKQKWVDIDFRKVWWKTESGRETEVSKMRASCQSHTDDKRRKGRVPSDENRAVAQHRW